MTGHRRGVNLTEVMLAVGILAVALLALIGLFTSGLSLLNQSRESQTAVQLARELLEQARAQANVPRADLDFDGTLPTAPVGGFPPAPYPARGPFTFQVATRVVRPDFIAVRVEVLWANHRVQTETCYYVP